MMKVLVACELSGVVRGAFIERGHDAISCDIEPSDVEGPHYQGDVRDILDDGWDLMIAHPPCTYLSVSGARWLYNKDGTRNEERWEKREGALNFVRLLLEAGIPKIALENPVSMISSEIRKPDQIIQPWQFGDSVSKTTCLWLKNLPKLKPTNIVDKGEIITHPSGRRVAKWITKSWSLSEKERQRVRSKTFKGIAGAMADQWGKDNE